MRRIPLLLALAVLAAPATAEAAVECAPPLAAGCADVFTRDGVDVSGSSRHVVTVDTALGAGTLRFQILDRGPAGDLTGNAAAQLDPAAVYRVRLATPWRVRESRLYGRGVTVAITDTHVDITLRPTPLSWAFDLPACTSSGACGDATTRATEDFAGRAEGYVTDLSTWTPASDVAIRSGFWEAFDAQYHEPATYDAARRAFTLRLANPHLRADGSPATGAYETFLPAALLDAYLGLADPAAVEPSDIVVTRTDRATTTRASAIVARVPGGIELRVAGIGYSSPTLRLYGRSRALPTRPRSLKARRGTGTTVRLSWLPPSRSGALRVTAYRVRCGGISRTVRARRATVAVRPGVRCSVRARSAVGYGPAATVRT